ncbi:hypothetical protein SteCoe_15279 [Stentor coeruleus]|uniref:Uncharacterized protein n=1 Tax=Stentor coeruleus TaxID=5963 RepID=A0A1R2C417_9CILI|nr:hypothetical protein SteCoe_15279 [Stentor coeruleus]
MLSTDSSKNSVKKKILILKKKESLKDLIIKTENDFHLESSDDALNFLTPTGPVTGPKFVQGKVLPYTVIGPSSLFSAQYEADCKKRLSKRLFHSNSFIKQIHTRPNAHNQKIDHKALFNEIMRKITENQKRGEEEERLRENNMSQEQMRKHQILYRNSQFLETIKSNLIDYSDKLLMKRSETSRNSNLFSFRNIKKESAYFDNSNKMIWYMSLRKNPENKSLESYMRIGHELNGLYTKVKKPNPFFKTENKVTLPVIEDQYKDLEIVGISKLALEVEAVKKVGYEYLSIELLDKGKTKFFEEIIEEHYDKF